MKLDMNIHDVSADIAENVLKVKVRGQGNSDAKCIFQNISCILCCHLLKCLIVKWFDGPHTHINYH